MTEHDAINVLKKLGFSDIAVKKLMKFHYYLIKWNSKYNLISKNSEKDIWGRHIVDSAQLVGFINPLKANTIADLGSGAGFPGLILAIFFQDSKFHVKLVEKSPVKRAFLNDMIVKLDIKADILDNVYEDEVSADIIVCRAFKKLDKIMKISREILKKPHKIMILKGKDAQAEINNLPMDKNYSYKLETSITDKKSKIVIVEVIK